MRDLDAIRARAAQHQQEIDQRHWFSVAQLAARWGLSASSVRMIPVADLPYKEFGTGLKLKRRRYRPADVEAFEARDVRRRSA